MPTEAPRIETARLVLRAHVASDFPQLVALYRTERSRYIGGPLAEPAVWAGFMNAVGHWPILGFGSWAIELGGSGAYVGQIGLSKPPEYPEHELGWLVFEDYEGKGYAFEAAERIKTYALDTLKLPSLVSYIDPANARSIRLARRLGGVQDEAAATPDGAPTLVFRYA